MSIKILKKRLASLGKDTTLNLFGNYIGKDGAKLIAEVLKVNTTLTTLNFWGNGIDNESAKFIAEALKVNTTLTTLNFGSNKIGNDGVKFIAEALKVNTTLTTLYIGGNKIGNKGAKFIAEAIKVNKTLTTLDLGESKIGDEGEKLIADAIEENRDLVKKVAKLLIKNFGQQKTDQIKIPLKYLKLYQVCDKNLLKKYIGDNKKFDVCTKKADTYISENFTKISGISKSGDLISNKTDEAKSPFAVKELLAKISSFSPKILWDIKTGKKVKVKTKTKVERKTKTFDDLKSIVSKFHSKFNSKILDQFKKIFSTENKDKSDITTLKKLLAIHHENLTEVIVKGYCEVADIKFCDISGKNNEFDNSNDLG